MDAVNQEERAAKVWPILVSVARNRGVITYKELGDSIGIHHRVVNHVLGVIQTHCLHNRLPPLTILVVNKASGRPGTGFVAWQVDDIDTGLGEVYGKDWLSEGNPFAYAASGMTIAGLAARILSDPREAAGTYRFVKDRGVAQQIFREALLQLYDESCAFCGLSFKQALVGAHIVPWSDATLHQRLAPNNGLLLCATHHLLFDTGQIVVGPDGTIVYYDPAGDDGPYSYADEVASRHLHGRPVRVPTDVRHRTDKQAWSWRYKNDGWNSPPWRFK